MIKIGVMALGLAVAGSALGASIVSGDARRGEELFQTQQCIHCHSFNGKGGTIASDLSRRIDRAYTPAVMASLMWNHAPKMWSTMSREGVARPTLTTQSAADLFAYFISERYFERPGDAARGKLAFTAQHCADCHGITSSPVAGAPPVAKWESLSDALVLAQQMWNHGAKMHEAFAQRKLAWGRLTSQELTDMLVYLQNLPETKGRAANFQIPPAEEGEKLFQSKGCVNCHAGATALENMLKNQTMTDIAVDMWDHQPKMKQPPPVFTADEMRQIVSYIWARQYFTGNGSAERGKKAFTGKKCTSCHDDPASGAPKLGKGKDAHSDITMVAALWGHGPRMLEVMAQKKIAWPQFTAREMSDVIAYLNSL
jgi:mono/diheme cytochrome c family protein